MQHWLSRTELLIGSEALHTLQHTKIAILGLGGVGGAAAEAVCRAGVGSMLLADCDTVDLTNLNRQLIDVYKRQAQRPQLFHGRPVS